MSADNKPYTLTQHAHAALELADHLAQVDPQGKVMLNTSGCVGWLACVYNEGSGSHRVIDLLLAGKDRRTVSLDLVRKYLLERPAIHEKDGHLVFQADHPSIGKRSYRLNLVVKPTWINNSGRTCSASYASNLFEPPMRVTLLYLLYQLAEAPGHGTKRLQETLTVVYIFSRLVHARKRAPDSHPAQTAVTLQWEPDTWAARYAEPALLDPQHRERYERALDMLRRRAHGEGPLARAALEDWAMSVVSQPNCPGGHPAERLLVRLEAFLHDVADMLLPPASSFLPGTALSLGKRLPAGMAVFHPDSARRRAFEGGA
ncbi:hypothetical protein JCM8208_001176 [Rhodotorula glutinis]